MLVRYPVLGTIILLCVVPGCSNKAETGWKEQPGLKVLVSFPPIHSFAKNVAGDDAQVQVVLTGSGPHSNPDPTTHQLKMAKHADLFLINGLGLDDPTAAKMQRAIGKPKWKLVSLGALLPEDCLCEGECNHKHDHEGEHQHPTDPHVWLSAKHARMMVESISKEMMQLDPAHAEGYKQRADAYIARLKDLEDYGKQLFAGKKDKKIIAFHESLRYFADCYGIEVAGTVQIEPGEEPSADHLRQLIGKCKREKVRVIAVEPQFKRDHAEAVLRELRQDPALADAELVEVDPLETADDGELTPDFYERKIRLNLENLAKALR